MSMSFDVVKDLIELGALGDLVSRLLSGLTESKIPASFTGSSRFVGE